MTASSKVRTADGSPRHERMPALGVPRACVRALLRPPPVLGSSPPTLIRIVVGPRVPSPGESGALDPDLLDLVRGWAADQAAQSAPPEEAPGVAAGARERPSTSAAASSDARRAARPPALTRSKTEELDASFEQYIRGIGT